MERGVLVSAPSRLHFGIVNPFNKSFRMYVSAGVAIDKPRTVVYVKRSDKLEVIGYRGDEVLSRIKGFADKHGLRGFIEIKSTAPKHVGLGSTTQLLLSASYGLTVINNLKIPVEEIAGGIGLGKFSAVGVYVFKHGGFVVDTGVSGGKPPMLPKLYIRLPFPEDWRFIILIPPGTGLRDREEEEVFSRAREASNHLVWRTSFYLFHELIPALMDRDFESFSKALGSLQESVGELFSEHQGGVFANHSVKAVEILRRNGVVGVGQSSWGPTVYGIVESEDEAEKIVSRVKEEFVGLIHIAKPDNNGVLIKEL